MKQTESASGPELNVRAAPAFVHPDDVVRDQALSLAEKKAMLASWVSDARAVENAPGRRRLDSGAMVEVDEILRALVSLDRSPQRSRRSHERPKVRREGRVIWLSRPDAPGGSNDNGDNPPSAPAGFAVPFRPSFVAACARPRSDRRAWAQA